MSFNRRGPDRRPNRPGDRPRSGGGDWKPRDQRSGGDRPAYPPRDRPGGDRPSYPPRDQRPGDRPAYPPRDRPGGDRPSYPPRGDRPFTPRPSFDRPPDEGAMSIRLDPRRVNALKHLAGEAGMRPGDLVRQWVEERLDASRTGAEPAKNGLQAQLEALAARVEALESSGGQPATQTDAPPELDPGPKRRKRTKVSAAPSSGRVALHDEMIELIADRGPMSAADLAKAITERGRYTPPRSGKPIDAATISQRVSNPTYRSRFTRDEGLIGLAEPAKD